MELYSQRLIVIFGKRFRYRLNKELMAIAFRGKRKITIGIENESGYAWVRPSQYFASGTSEEVLLPFLENGKTKFSICQAVLV